MEEKELIQGLRDRDPKALQAIHDRLRLSMSIMLERKFPFRKDEIEDLITKALMDVWNSKAAFDSISHFRAYLYSAALNKSRTLAKQQQRQLPEKKDLSYWFDHQQVTPEEQRKKEYVISFIMAYINELPDRSRDVLTLTLENLGDLEIANKLNIKLNSVHKARSRGIQILREKLGNRMPDDPNAFAYLIALLLIQYYLDQQL